MCLSFARFSGRFFFDFARVQNKKAHGFVLHGPCSGNPSVIFVGSHSVFVVFLLFVLFVSVYFVLFVFWFYEAVHLS